MGLIDGAESESMVDSWLSSDKWPMPKWYDNRVTDSRIQTYDAFYRHQIRIRYLELESDFRSVIGNFGKSGDVDRVTAGRVFDFLQSARHILEQDKPNLLVATGLLDLADRYMVWLYPPHIADIKVSATLNQFAAMKLTGTNLLVERLTKLTLDPNRHNDLGDARAALDEAIGFINERILEEGTSSGLQIERLKRLRLWGFLVLSIVLMISPMVTNPEAMQQWTLLLSVKPLIIAGWLSSLGIVVMGLAGGVLSGLLQARNSTVSLVEFQGNMLKLQLKPLVGSLVSLILYILLSWQVLPGISIENVGSYLLISFLSGFSERYFLNLLEVNTGDSDQGTKVRSAKGPDRTDMNARDSESGSKDS